MRSSIDGAPDARELMNDLRAFSANANVRVRQADKLVEVRANGVTKGTAVECLLSRRSCDGIIAAGDDRSPEDMFRVLSGTAVAVKAGPGASAARYMVPDFLDVRNLLEGVAG